MLISSMKPFGIYEASLAFKEQKELLCAKSEFYLAVIIMSPRNKKGFLCNEKKLLAIK